MQQNSLFNDDDSFPTKKQTRALLKVVKSQDADFEWYPTDAKQIECIKNDMLTEIAETSRRFDENPFTLSVLDVGAGDGRVLCELTSGERYAIEKSMPLVNAMDRSIFVIGSNFFEQSLFDKRVDTVFSNPPYSMYEAWASKILSEANACLIYLVLPARWSSSAQINQLLTLRKAETTVIGEFDYLDAHREARAKVQVIKVKLGTLTYHRSKDNDDERNRQCNTDPFSLWFDATFPLTLSSKPTEWTKEQDDAEAAEQALKEGGEIVKREGFVKLLVTVYNAKMQELFLTYQKVTSIPQDLLKELGVSMSGVKAGLRLKVKSLKDCYWKQLFSGLDSITNKLCTETRNALLKKLTAHTQVDFTESNAVAVVIWVIKQSNVYFDEQICSLFESLTEQENITLFRSNKRTIQMDRWRYASERYSSLGPYGLDYRIVVSHCGGYSHDSLYGHRCGLRESAIALINDLTTVANNLNFDATDNALAQHRSWEAGKAQYFHFFNHTTQETEVLFEVKAFKKGTLHLRMSEKFIQKLNVVHGRLKGWVRSASEAVDELNVPQSVAEDAFETKLHLTLRDVPMLSHTKAA